MRARALLLGCVVLMAIRCNCGPLDMTADGGTGGGTGGGDGVDPGTDAGFCRGPSGGPDGGHSITFGHSGNADFQLTQMCMECPQVLYEGDGGLVTLDSGNVGATCTMGNATDFRPCRPFCCSCPDGGGGFWAHACVSDTCADEATTCAEALAFDRDFGGRLCP